MEVLKDCPTLRFYTFTDAEDILAGLMKPIKDRNSAEYKKYFDELMFVHDQKMKYMPEFVAKGTKLTYSVAGALGRKAIDYLTYAPKPDVKQAYAWLKESVETDKADTWSPIFYYFMDASMRIVKADVSHTDQFFQDYLNVGQFLNDALAAETSAAKKDNLEKMKQTVDAIFINSGVADCESLQKIYGPQVEANQADSVFLKYVNEEVVADIDRGEDSVIVAYDNQAIPRAYLYKYRYPFYTYNDWSPEPLFQGMNQNKVIWRLAEIYLLRAECRARQGKANAVEDLNEIRRRAYGNDSHAFPCAEDEKNGLSGNIQLAIFREREKELLHEGHRYYDIVRNGWCYLRGEDTYDYIRNEISEAFAKLTDQDIQAGALYYGLSSNCFENNDLIRQNRYWNRRMQ